MDSLFSFPVGLFHPLQHAGLSRRSTNNRVTGKVQRRGDSAKPLVRDTDLSATEEVVTDHVFSLPTNPVQSHTWGQYFFGVQMRMRTIRKALVLAMALSGIASFGVAQTAQKPAFEVASIKRNTSGKQRVGVPVAFSPGRFTATNATLVDVIIQAYLIRRVQMQGGPDWIDSDAFDIVAKAPDGEVTPDQMRQMVQVLVEDRFQLKFHTEKKEMPVYTVILGKEPPKLQSAEPTEVTGVVSSSGAQLAFTRMPIVGLVNAVSNILHVPVIDRTGLTGSYDFALDIGKFMPPTVENGPRRSDIFDIRNAVASAIEEQLGLKMEQHKELLDITVIDHVERPTEN
jgi:uncharacterized protein (TIGR03435 family)